MRAAAIGLAACVLGLSPAAAVVADEHGLRQSWTAPVVSPEVIFSDEEIRVIREYYEERGDVERGRGRGKGLPPGIAKNLARGKPLPPGIAKQALPGDLQRRLPDPRAGHERIIIDGRVLLVEIATGIVRDILTEKILR
ncbi:MAG: anti-virulence regulator CigR family protein [Gammaproteobacteria bacterium]